MFLLLVYYADDLYAYKSPVCQDLFPRYQQCYPNIKVTISNDQTTIDVPITDLSLEWKGGNL